jgi:molybdenum cofactor synthesis domain-containing protein
VCLCNGLEINFIPFQYQWKFPNSMSIAMNLRFGILTVSDRAASGERADLSGPLLMEAVQKQGWKVVKHAILPDDFIALRDELVTWTDMDEMDVILTSGGTGFSPRDITPEATLSVIERPAPGLAEAMRAASLKVTPHAMLSRAMAGIRGRVLIINLPGSPSAAVENFEVLQDVLPHAIQLLHQDPDAEGSHRKETRV